MAYHFFLEKSPPNSIYVCSERSVDTFIRSSIQGGICFPQKPYFKSCDFDEILIHWNLYNNSKCDEQKIAEQIILNQLYQNLTDYLVYLDAVSLYASAEYMFVYPSGKPDWKHNLDDVKDALNRCDENLPLGIVDFEITPNKDAIYPLLSHLSKDSRLLYTVEPKQRLTKTTIGVMEEVKYNHSEVLRFSVFLRGKVEHQ